MALNIVAITGRLVHDVELHQTTSGKSICTVSVAVDRAMPDADGERKADFFDVVCFGKTAEFVSRYFTKGSSIAVDGRLTTRDWKDKNGNKRKAVEIAANNVSFCGGKTTGTNSETRAQRSAAAANAKPETFATIDANEDLPF